MIKMFTLIATLFSLVVFTSAVIAHTKALPHGHDNGEMLLSHGWGLGVFVLVLVSFILVRTAMKWK